jgi:hypothetical protein
MKVPIRLAQVFIAACGVVSLMLPAQARASLEFGVDVGNYVVMYEGVGGDQLNINNFGYNGATREWTGDIGIAGTGQLGASGPGTLVGNVNFSAANSGQASINNTTITGTVNYGVSSVQTTMNALNALSTSLGAEATLGTSLSINTSTPQTVLASNGALVGGNLVFNVTSVSTNNGQNLFIQGNGSNNVVFDVNTGGTDQFHGNIILEDMTGKYYGQAGYAGLTPDQVLFNLYSGDNLDANNNGDNAHPDNIMEGTFLDPDGSISFVNTRIDGRIFGGDSQNMQIVSGDTIVLPTSGPPPVGSGTPEPSALIVWSVLGGAAIGLGWRRKRKAA